MVSVAVLQIGIILKYYAVKYGIMKGWIVFFELNQYMSTMRLSCDPIRLPMCVHAFGDVCAWKVKWFISLNTYR